MIEENSRKSAGSGWGKTVGRSMAASAVLLCALAIAGCKPAAVPPQQQIVVKTITVAPEKLVLDTILPGRTNPYRIADIRPQVSGVVLQRLFEEGADVEEGQSLYQIDPAPFEAALNSAKAGMNRAQVSLPAAESRMKRYKDALEERAVSQQDYDDAEASVRQIQADIEFYRAQVTTAEINVAYSKVISPISGRIGASAVTPGGTVVAYQQALATVQQLDPIYVDVPQSTTEMMRLKSMLKAGLLSHDEDTINMVDLILDDGSKYKYTGTFQFRDVTVDPTTSTMTLRMIFPNPDGDLLPGMYVRAVVEEGTDPKAVLLPQETVVRDRRGRPFVWVVNSESKVERRALELTRAVGNRWLLKSGLNGGEHIVIEGLQGIRTEGVPVVENFAGVYHHEEPNSGAAAAQPAAAQPTEAQSAVKAPANGAVSQAKSEE